MPSDSRRHDASTFNGSTNPHDPIDEVNRAILTALQDDPRISMSALAREVGMSSPAVTERVQRLERSGVITGYRTEISPAALGLPVTAFTRVRPSAGHLPRVAEIAAALPQVSECHRITGEDCFLIKVHAPSVAELEDILDAFVMHGQTVSSIVVASPVPARPLPIGGPAQGPGRRSPQA